MKKRLNLYIETETGQILDGEKMRYNIPQVESASLSSQYLCEGLDISGSVTVTGNLIVQQSDWVYLRGPITGSRAVINGPITASGLWVRNTEGEGLGKLDGMGYLKVDEDIEVRGVSYWEVFVELRRAVRELKNRIEGLEKQIDGNKK